MSYTPPGGGGSGDMLAANNLSDVALLATAQSNMGMTDVLLDVNQAAHGFFLGDCVYWTGAAWAWSDASANASARIDGHVWQIADFDNVTINRTPGSIIGGLTDDAFAAIVAGTRYYLSGSVPGLVTTAKPDIPVPACVGSSGGEAYFTPFDVGGVQAAPHIAVVAPGVNNDSVDTAGLGRAFGVGDEWLDTTGPTRYSCSDATATSAAWRAEGGTGVIVGEVATTDANATTLITAALNDDTVYIATVDVSARDQDGTKRAAYRRTVMVYREAAGIAILGGAGVQSDFTDETTVAWNCTFDVDGGSNLRVRVTGEATVDWRGELHLVAAA